MVCALVDTGFNGYLLWELSESDASAFPGALSPLYEPVEVAGGKLLATVGTLSIHWFEDDFIQIDTLVAASAKPHRPGDPIVFIGTALLSGMSLFVDFLNGILRIERSS
jgi:predicted aspartyl protease